MHWSMKNYKIYPLLQLNLFQILIGLFFTAAGLSQPSSAPGFSSSELQWIAAHPELRVIVNDAPLPISMWGDSPGPKNIPPHPPEPVSETGYRPPRGSMIPLKEVISSEQSLFKGVAADYLEEIRKLTGIHFRVVLVSFNNLGAIHHALMQGRADLMPVIMVEKRKPGNVQVTQPYIKVPMVIVTQPDVAYIEELSTLISMKIAGTLPVQQKLMDLGLNMPIRRTLVENGLKGVAVGKFDAFICELSGVSHALSRMPVSNIKISGELPQPSSFGMAVPDRLEGFLPVFNKALAAIPEKRKSIIWQKWFSIDYEKKWVASAWTKALLAGGILLLALLGGGIFYFYRRFAKMRATVVALDPHLLSLNLDQNIMITQVTRAFLDMTGFDDMDLVGKPLTVLGSPLQKKGGAVDELWVMLKSGKVWKGEIKLIKKNGSRLWAHAVISPLRRKNEEKSGYTVIYQDISQQKHFERLAVKDELTGLYNRRYYNELAPVLAGRACAEARLFALILMDVDYFKKYNDHYGHPAGDKVLASIGQTLTSLLKRDSEKAFRLGGEEFGVLMIVSSAQEALDTADTILQRIREARIPHELNPPGVVTLSAGVHVLSIPDAGQMEAAYQKADEALYKAKTGGRNQTVLSLP